MLQCYICTRGQLSIVSAWHSVNNPKLDNLVRWTARPENMIANMFRNPFEIQRNPRGVPCVWKCKYLQIFLGERKSGCWAEEDSSSGKKGAFCKQLTTPTSTSKENSSLLFHVFFVVIWWYFEEHPTPKCSSKEMMMMLMMVLSQWHWYWWSARLTDPKKRSGF